MLYLKIYSLNCPWKIRYKCSFRLFFGTPVQSDGLRPHIAHLAHLVGIPWYQQYQRSKNMVQILSNTVLLLGVQRRAETITAESFLLKVLLPHAPPTISLSPSLLWLTAARSQLQWSNTGSQRKKTIILNICHSHDSTASPSHASTDAGGGTKRFGLLLLSKLSLCLSHYLAHLHADCQTKVLMGKDTRRKE